MAGTKAGGQAAAKTNRQKYDAEYLKRYGMTFYQYNGSIGGKNGHTGGFGQGEAGRERARKYGSIGGRISRRGKVVR